MQTAEVTQAPAPVKAPAPDSDDEVEEIVRPMPAANRGRRTSVSAESMTPSADNNYEKVNIPKSESQRERIQVAILKNFLFKNLDEEQAKEVLDAMAEKRVQSGEEIIRQGGVGDFFYVIEQGRFDVFVSKGGAPPVKVVTYEGAGSFGELALMYNAPRAATIVAASEGILWALDRVTFRRILMQSTSRKRRMYESFLEEVPILKALEPYERAKIADTLESQTFLDGEVVIRQGDPGENFYIIESGEASVSQKNEAGEVSSFPPLKKGQYFGELALLSNKPRAATIIAKGKLKVATMGKQAFDRLLGSAMDIMKRNTTTYTAPVQRAS